MSIIIGNDYWSEPQGPTLASKLDDSTERNNKILPQFRFRVFKAVRSSFMADFTVYSLDEILQNDMFRRLGDGVLLQNIVPTLLVPFRQETWHKIDFLETQKNFGCGKFVHNDGDKKLMELLKKYDEASGDFLLVLVR